MSESLRLAFVYLTLIVAEEFWVRQMQAGTWARTASGDTVKQRWLSMTGLWKFASPIMEGRFPYRTPMYGRVPKVRRL